MFKLLIKILIISSSIHALLKHIKTVAFSLLITSNLDNFSQFSSDYFRVKYPDSLKIESKPLKTHDSECFFKAENIKGFNFGVTVN
jgi:hypothetical protein